MRWMFPAGPEDTESFLVAVRDKIQSSKSAASVPVQTPVGSVGEAALA